MSCVELHTFTQLPLGYLYELSVLDLESRVRQSVAAETSDFSGPWDLKYPSPGGVSLLQKSLLPLSPTRRFLALISPRHFIILRASPESRGGHYEFAYKLHSEARPLIPPDSEDPGDEATDAAALTLLLPPPARNGDGSHPCTGGGEPILVEVFAVGFTSGTLRVYSQDGKLLLEQLLHEEPVRKVHCFTNCHALGTNPRVPPSDQESLLLLFHSAMVLVSGSALSAVCRGVMESEEGGRGEAGLEVEHRKWKLEDAREVNDVACLGVVVPSLFDHIQDGCVLGGFEQRVRGVTAPEEQFLAAGVSPMFGFYSLNDQNSPNMSELVAEVATRVKSAVSAKLATAGGWLWSGATQHEQGAVGGREEAKKKPPRILRPIGLPLSSNISDSPRDIHSLILSPRGVLAVATDNFGRVLLLDTRRKVVSRVWKGYRDAQCGWVQSREEGQSREGLFLIIYAPKRGILEIWPSQSGSRVGAFTVGKDARLIHTAHGILGLGQLVQQQRRIGQTAECYSSPLSSCFLLHPTGLVREVLVPFHLTLPPTQVDQAQDEVLLKMLKNSLLRRTQEFSDAEKIILAIDSPAQVLSGLHMILRSCTDLPSSSVLHVLGLLVEKQKQKLELKGGGENDSEDVREKRERLVPILRHYTHLTQSVYMILRPDPDPLNALASHSKQGVSSAQPQVNSEGLMLLFNESEEKLAHTLSMLQSYRPAGRKEGRDSLKLVNFLSCFHIKEKISLKSSIHEEKRVRLGQFLFNSDTSAVEETALLSLLSQSEVAVRDLLLLLLSYWFSGPEVTAESIQRFSDSLKVLTSSPSSSSLFSPELWQEYRARCADSCMLGHALVATMAGRLMGCPALQGEGTASPDTWEPVSEEDQHWGRLVDQLQSLNSLFNVAGRLPNWAVPLSAREQGISCRHYVTERLGCYLQSVAASVDCVLGGDGERAGEGEDIVKKLCLLRETFPLSLSPDLLLAHSAVHAFSGWRKERGGAGIVRGVQCLLHLQSLPLRQGLTIYCWEAYLHEQMEALLQLVEKVGRCPSEKNLHKSLGMGLASVKVFISQTKCLVDILQKTIKKLLTSLDLLSEEERREDFLTEMSLTLPSLPSAPCVVDTCISLKPVTSGACERLYLLLFCLEYVVSLDFRSVRPLSLITSRELLYEFKLRVSQEVRPYADVQKEREKFLAQIISHHTDPSHLCLDTSSLDTLYSLSELLELDTEVTRANLSVSLYAAGQDDRGEDILLTLSDKDVVCEDLVSVLGLRLGSLIFNKTSSQHSTYLLSQLPTLASKWVELMWERRYESQLIVSPGQKQTLESVKRLCETIKGVLSAQSKHKELISTLSAALEYLFILP